MTLLFSGLVLGETMDDLVERDGLYYKEFTAVMKKQTTDRILVILMTQGVKSAESKFLSL
jgi:hypothetical protein